MTQDKKVIKLETFFTHFFTNGADKHFIIAEDYKIFIESIEQILANINAELLQGQAKYEVCIVANKEGGFWSTVGIIGTLISIPAVLDSEFIHGFYTTLTGHDYDARSIGENVGSFLRDATVSFFSKNATELSKVIPDELNLDKAIYAKNGFYRMCATSQDISGVSFSDSNEPEIQKKDFVNYIVPDVDKILPAEQFVDVVTIVKSVNVKSDAKWSVKIGENVKPKSVEMLDEEFKKEFLSGRYAIKQTEQDDTMTVLLEKKKKYVNGHEQDAGLSIVKVYRFNDIQILPIPSDVVHKTHRPKIDLFNFQDETAVDSPSQSGTNH